MLDRQINEIREWLMLSLSICLALILTLVPMPHWLHPFRPAWVLLVLMFWTLILPGRISITLAWVLGILLDVLNGSLLGEHALALTVVIYLTARLSNQLRMFSLFQQGVAVFFMVLFYQFILFCIQGFLGDLPEGWLYWSSAFSSMLLWPWVFIIMRERHRRFEN